MNITQENVMRYLERQNNQCDPGMTVSYTSERLAELFIRGEVDSRHYHKMEEVLQSLVVKEKIKRHTDGKGVRTYSMPRKS